MTFVIILLVVAVGVSIYLCISNEKLKQELREQQNRPRDVSPTFISPVIDQPTMDQLEYNKQLIDRARREVDEARAKADLEIANQSNRIEAQKLLIDDQLKLLNEQFADLKRKQMTIYYDEMQTYNQWAGECQTEASAELKKITDEIDDARAKQQVINEEIQRNREIKEQKDYFRIIILDDAKGDIELLNSIRQKLTKPTILDKIIYDNYISKPVKEMIKRVLKGKDYCGIYKITNIDTNEAYIGKSVHIADRWQNHLKSAHNLDGVADSMFQRALKKYGDDCWTFEVIEEVPKDNLNAREKYWIDYYATNKYGFNERLG